MKTKFQKWGDTNQFHEVVKNLNYPRVYTALKARDYTIEYGLKIKLHGTNACVRVETDGTVVGQKRSSDVAIGRDNCGFAAWLNTREYFFSRLANSELDLYIYGEWCGPGIQSGVSCSMIGNKMFFVYAIDAYKEGEFQHRIYCPDLIETTLVDAPDEVVVLPWLETISINLVDKMKTEPTLAYLNDLTEKIGQRDPFISDVFEIDGPGEGVVAYPMLGRSRGILNADERELYNWFHFKSKSEAHRVNRTKTANSYDPSKLATANSFADMFCTEQRFLQGFTDELNEVRDIKLTGKFVKWVSADIFKESKTEREACAVEWASLVKTCTTRAALWYKSKIQELPQDA